LSIKLSIVIPVFNEEEILPMLCGKIKALLPELKKRLLTENDTDVEVLFVNDGSKDNTLSVLDYLSKKEKYYRYISLSRNFGHQPAVAAGIAFARGEAVVVIDADLQDPPELIVDMVEKWKNGFEVVYAVKRRRKAPFLKNIAYKLYYKINAIMSDFPVQKDAGDFCLLDRRVVDVINSLPEKEKYTRGLRAWVGFKQAEIYYDRQERKKGKSKYSLFSLIRLAFHGILSTSVKPLFLSGVFSTLSILIILGVIIFSMASRLLLPESVMPKGWTSIMITISVFSLLQLISIWLLSLYIARIYSEALARPPYVVSYDSLTQEKESKQYD